MNTNINDMIYHVSNDLTSINTVQGSTYPFYFATIRRPSQGPEDSKIYQGYRNHRFYRAKGALRNSIISQIEQSSYIRENTDWTQYAYRRKLATQVYDEMVQRGLIKIYKSVITPETGSIEAIC